MANISFRLARVFAWIGLASILIFIAGATVWSSGADAPSSYNPNLVEHGSTRVDRVDFGLLALVGSAVTSLIATLGTASTILLGWRTDLRQGAESKLKNQQQELQIEQLKLQLFEVQRTSAKVEPNTPAHA
ncbi:hypothetical protein ABID58_002311 [Bradyrhizobium sp. S3.2.6]|uniref:hypothetical protein n=1 Tax=Bradyrhizobium sp. S3.2.6 TaxID=3156428 RepID=UPI003398BB5E